MGKKRSVDGQVKTAKASSASSKSSNRTVGSAQLNKTPQNAQAPPPTKSSNAEETHEPREGTPVPKKQKLDDRKTATLTSQNQNPSKPSKAESHTNHARRSKQPRLPDHVKIHKRPLLHPAPPSPFASSSSPKTLYITHTSPFISTVKRVRRLLSEISKRQQQSASSQRHSRFRQRHNNTQQRSKPLEANGRLQPADVEREIAEGIGQSAVAVGDEEVFLKATGRAIERALQFGVHFQGEDDCKVRIEMGSVQAIDDIQIPRKKKGGRDDEEEKKGDGEGGKEGSKKQKSAKTLQDEDIPENRMRTLSSITVAVGLK
ncbi:hypothetical protein DM02DRAFT_726555 [Periconia macrospinosa]|uniref:Uncharacterized protein n=1 Tax=Periconia macrospinosa TaxID=97972 RepID=A0A2V1DZ79_9PLEO|nr:hypothetical protein DM02DRAFT_726555 [Periconia macrospinosa]